MVGVCRVEKHAGPQNKTQKFLSPFMRLRNSEFDFMWIKISAGAIN